ncbi:MAG: phenylalanine--tRNA ligase subunit alpha, partial [Hydrogenimonas sp.]|nr:phenylalanine--tRNA ligase subunit alpha [Hydrogenimonas sp.]
MEHWIEKIAEASSLEELEELRVLIFGKKGEMAKAFAGMKSLSAEEKPKVAKELNLLKQKLMEAYEAKRGELEEAELNRRLKREAIDVSLYTPAPRSGALHPVTHTMDRIIEYFTDLNFAVETGPLVEDEFHNFEALNLPDYHPARDIQD